MAMASPIPPAFVGFLQELEAEPRKSLDEELLEELQVHERAELDIVKEYERAASGASDAGVRYLMGLILEDERRHHRLNAALSDEFRQALLWLHEEAPLPPIKASGSERDQLLAETERFLEIEHAGKRQLSELRPRVGQLHAGLLELIVSLMQADTEKHIHILEFIKKSLKER